MQVRRRIKAPNNLRYLGEVLLEEPLSASLVPSELGSGVFCLGTA